LSIRNFQIVPEQAPSAVVELAARIVNDKGEIKGARIFKVTEPVQAVQADQAAAALNKAFGKVAQDLVEWTADTI
jgi:phospholipid/cholesterol/gamma-HCH transport system substrate-binding protein